MWDHDTLREERRQFPQVLELITGKFLRHSRELYLWRIEDRKRRLQRDPENLALLDDLAVAYHKVGDTAQAIAIMERSERLAPARYETQSNLGTFYMLAGQLERGLTHIDAALKINPEAHFGRERYQKLLVEHVLADPTSDFFEFLREHVPAGADLEAERARAQAGVLGMMRFANHDNPLLLVALGDLLSVSQQPAGAKRLAARAYLQASYVAPAAERDRYRERAVQELHLQTGTTIDRVEAELAAELAEAKRWIETVRDHELAWIRAGGDVDAAFDAFYTEEPAVDLGPEDPSWLWRREPYGIAPGDVLVAAGAAGLLASWLWRRRRRRAQAQARELA